jgi:cysteinyl-tRNA synthetase, unknown class
MAQTEAFTLADIEQLKTKQNGGQRLVVCYLSIGEAEDYRYYWQEAWSSSHPDWLELENPNWEGNYKVQYWAQGWQEIIFGNDSSYLKRIVAAEFDGVYLDIVDAFEYFEDGE